jgi:hypothetical protein
MPHSPGQAYRDGWISWPDYLGYEPRVILPFEEARKIVRGLGCKGKNGYVKLYKERKLPVGIPHNPSRAYKNSGWITWADFLGKEPYWYKPLPFKEARQIARKLGCKNIDDYHRLYKQAKLPKGMPYNPDRAYCKKVIGR